MQEKILERSEDARDECYYFMQEHPDTKHQKEVEKMAEHAENGTNYDGKCYISHSYCKDDAQAVVDLIEEKFPNLRGKVEMYNIGTTIGSHTGPGTVALFFYGDERID